MIACRMSVLPDCCHVDSPARLRDATRSLASAEPASWSLLARDGMGELLRGLASGDPIAWIFAVLGVLGSAAVWGIYLFLRHRRKRPPAPLSEGETDAPHPVLSTKGDHFIARLAGRSLRQGESVVAQAYGFDRRPESTRGMATFRQAATMQSRYAILTDRRLLLHAARVGAFGPIFESIGHESIDRRVILGAEVGEGRTVLIHLLDGSARRVWVPSNDRHFSNQDAFIRRLPGLLHPADCATPLTPPPAASSAAVRPLPPPAPTLAAPG